MRQVPANQRLPECIRGCDWLLNPGDDIQRALTFPDFAGNTVYARSRQHESESTGCAMIVACV